MKVLFAENVWKTHLYGNFEKKGIFFNSILVLRCFFSENLYFVKKDSKMLVNLGLGFCFSTSRQALFMKLNIKLLIFV